MKNWTKENLHEYDIKAVDMCEGQEDIAQCVTDYIYKRATPENIQEMLDNVDDYIIRACHILGWSDAPKSGGLVVNVWQGD